MKSRIAAISLVALVGLGVAAGNASDTKAKTGKESTAKTDQATLQKEAKITMDEAKAIALKKVPGTIDSGELEREHGKLIYSFDIKVSGKSGITEVAVDAINGKIIDVHHETPAKEAAEKKKEAREKKAAKKQ